MLVVFFISLFIFFAVGLFWIILRQSEETSFPIWRAIGVLVFTLIPLAALYLISIGAHSEAGFSAVFFPVLCVIGLRWLVTYDWNHAIHLFIRFTVIIVYPGLLIIQLLVSGLTIMDDQMYPSVGLNNHVIYTNVEYQVSFLFTDYPLFTVSDPHRGEMVIVKNPLVDQPYFIEEVISWLILGLYPAYTTKPDPMLVPNRIMAVAGDSIRIYKNRVYLNQNMLPLSYPEESEEMYLRTREKIYLEENHQVLYPVRLKTVPTLEYETAGVTIKVPRTGDLFRYTFDPTDEEQPSYTPTFHYYINQLEISEALYQTYYRPLLPEDVIEAIEERKYVTHIFQQDFYFVLNDDRENFDALDSRVFGFITRAQIHGKIALRVHPFHQLRFF